MKNKQWLFLVPCTIIAVFLFCLWEGFGKEIYLTATFARRICNNLISTGYYPDESACTLSESIFEVMEATFPIGSTVEFVEAGMQGFNVIGEDRHYPAWDKSIIARAYIIIPKVFFHDYVEFIFQDWQLKKINYGL